MIFSLRTLDYLIVLDAVAHVWLAIACFAFWRKSLAKDIFHFNEELAIATQPMAKVLGAMYLVFAFCFMMCHVAEGVPLTMRAALLFCQVVAGSVAGKVVSKQLFLIQAVPGLIGLFMVWQMSDFIF